MNAGTLVKDKDGGDTRSRCKEGLTKEYKDKAQANPHKNDNIGGREVVCSNCMHGGELLCCSGKGCQRRYHTSCVDPPLNYIPLGFWHCISCIKKKIELGVHFVSEGVKSILDSREVNSDNKVLQREYFVKYHGLAHAHNCWIPESKILLEAPKLLAKFKRKLQIPNCQVIRWKRDWSVPHRLLLKREIVLSKQSDQHLDGHGDNGSICRYEWLVKWTGLGYDNVTWELDDAPFLTSPEGMKLKNDYESRHKRADRLSKNHFEASKERKTSRAELSVLPSGDSPGFYNQHLSYVNRLRMCWHKCQSALVVDDQIDQERVMKVILFILSLKGNVKGPFLIISTSTALSVWETEFLHVAPSANLVVYKGSRDVRSGIRALEFFNEDDGILFKILLSSYDIIVEDLHALRCIPWEAIVIDECQRPRVLGHFDNINILKAEMRLLLVSGQIKEDQDDYIKLLSFLKSGHHGSNIAQMETCISASISTLKSQLEKYVVFKCKSDSTRFVEFWVPACLSSLQLEQYCSLLLSNLMLLCSGHKSDSVDALHDLIISTRKCCDHPYLLDPTLHGFVTKGLPVEKHLNIGITASGKVQLLEKLLLEARSHGLRVLILFQSTCGSRSIGNILDDVLCQRFGKDCYVRYDRGYAPKIKQAALDTFNDKESGKFVFLMESRACLSSVKLSSVDTVILFDSDLDPQNDLRGLQRMSISSQFKQFTVLRLYSYFTVEEKVLMLAKEGIALDSNVQLISQSTCHTLLKWGTSYLFKKLDDLHGSVTSVSTPFITDQSLLCDVTREFSSQLVCGVDDADCHGWSFISRIQHNGGEYARNILLIGERMMKKLGNEPCAFCWSDLEGRYPQWKFMPVLSQRIRKTVRHFDHIVKESECENDTFMGKRTVPKDNVDPKRRKVSKDVVKTVRHFDHIVKESECENDTFMGKRTVPKDNVDPKRRKVSKDVVKTKGRKVSNHATDPKTMNVLNDIADLKGRRVSKSTVDSKYWKTRLKSKKTPSVINRACKSNGNSKGLSNVLDSTMHPVTNKTTGTTTRNLQFSEKKKLLDIPNGIKCLPKLDISGLCDILHFSKDCFRSSMDFMQKNVKAVAVRLLQHIFKHYNVNCHEVSTVQAFEISVCWLAASLLKHKINRKDSLALAKLYLNFDCKEEEATDVYSELWKHVKDFSYLKNGVHVEKCNTNGASDSKMPELNDLEEEEKQKDLLGTRVSNIVKSIINEHDLQMKSPPTVALQGQTWTHEICLSPKIPGSFPVEADAISVESSSENDGMRAVTLITAEDSSLEHWCNDVNPVTDSLERQGPVRSTDNTQSDYKASEDPHSLVNEVLAIDSAMNMSTHPVQLDSVETDAVTCVSTAVPDVTPWYSVMSPVCGESTALDFAETTLPYMQPMNANLWPLPQMAMSAVPSFMDHNSASTVMPLDDIFNHSGEDHCYIHEAEVILEAPNDLVEPVASSFFSPVILQPFPSMPMNENTTHVPHSITIPGCMNSDYVQAYSVMTSETSHLAYSDPLLGEMESIENVNEEAFIDPLPIEMEGIKKVNEEAFKIHEQKRLQLQSDYEKESEKLSEKYSMLLEKVNTETALKMMELETQRKLVLRNKVLAEVWMLNLDRCERAAEQCTEQCMNHA